MRFCSSHCTCLQINRNRRTPLLNCSSVIPDFLGDGTVELIRSRYGWNFAQAALADNLLTDPSRTVRRILRTVPSAKRTSSRYMPHRCGFLMPRITNLPFWNRLLGTIPPALKEDGVASE